MRHKLFFLAALALMLIAYSPPASAELQLVLSSGADSVIIGDGGGDDSNGATGAITYIGSVGGWTTNVTTGLGSAIVINSMDLSSVNVSGNGAADLVIKFTETDWSKPLGAGLKADIGGTLGHASILYQIFVSPSNQKGEPTPVDSTLVAQSALMTTAAFADSFGGNLAPDTQFAITQVVTIGAARAGGNTSFDADLTVPEPAAITLLGCFLVGAFGVLRWKTRNS